MNESATKLTKDEIAKLTAKRYLADIVFMLLMGKSQASKLRQITKLVDKDYVTPRLLKNVLGDDHRFLTADRRWMLSARAGNAARPVEFSVRSLLQGIGTPMPPAPVAAELAQIYKRGQDYFEKAVRMYGSTNEKFFTDSNGNVGVSAWLLNDTSSDEDQLIFDNFMTKETVEEFTKSLPKAKWDPAQLTKTIDDMVADSKSPLPVKILALTCLKELGEDYDPVAFFEAVCASEKSILLSDQKLYPAKQIKTFEKDLSKLADELAKLPAEADEEDTEGPVNITETDYEEIVAMVLEKGSASSEDLIETIMEVGSDEPSFAEACENLTGMLKDDDRIMWAGGTMWSQKEEFPEEINEVPESLAIPPSVPFETPEGDVFDVMLEEDGFEGTLKTDIFDPLAEDVCDEDIERTLYQPNGESQRCVLKYHHKTAGTFPLCQINPDFFGTEPEIIPAVFSHEGKRKKVYINNTTRLIYGMEDFYSEITDVSGTVFNIVKTSKSGEFKLEFEDEIDEKLGIDLNRSLELLDLKARFESTEMPVYDVIVDILEHKSGITFAQLVNETNIVHRCSRLLVASLLSGYHCFTTRGKSGLWQYDDKKRSQGFNKSKKKYIKKEEEVQVEETTEE